MVFSESWKGDEAKSGGISSNIGVHFFEYAILDIWRSYKKMSPFLKEADVMLDL